MQLPHVNLESVAQLAARGLAAPAEELAHTAATAATAGTAATATASASRRVLILSADLGSGHDVLAKALAGELMTRSPGTQVTVRNGLRDANRGAYAVMKHSMEGLVSRAPASHGRVYDFTSRPRVADALRYATDTAFSGGLARLIAQQAPDTIISTFPMVTSALGRMRDNGRISQRVVGLVIDSNPHAMWFSRGVDQHVVMNPNDVARARQLGATTRGLESMPVTSARPSIDPRFHGNVDRVEARQLFGLPLDRPVVLVSGGSGGSTTPLPELTALAREADVTVAVATGRNEELLGAIRAQGNPNVIGIPFTTEMPSLLRGVDAVISENGGMTAYESFASGTPVIMHRALPGHGVDAARALDTDGIARYAATREELLDAVASLRTGGEDLTARARNARAIFDEQQSLAQAVLG